MLPFRNSNFKLDIRMRIFSSDNVLIFGKGVAQLLRQCELTHSLHKAAKELNMSYSKALLLISRAEDGFKTSFLDRHIGGKDGGGSTLTSFAKQLLKEYTEAETDIAEFAKNRLQQISATNIT